jgi:hypothetical protein
VHHSGVRSKRASAALWILRDPKAVPDDEEVSPLALQITRIEIFT